MKGTIVATWIRTFRKVYGDDVVNEAMGMVGFSKDKIFSPLENVEDEKPKKIVEYISKEKGIDSKLVWRNLGKDNLYSFE